MVLADRVRASVRTYGLWPRGGRVLVALSGGSDSTALLHLLGELQGAGELASEAQVPIHVEQANVVELAGRWRTSNEDAGRRARYAWFERVADELGADA